MHMRKMKDKAYEEDGNWDSLESDEEPESLNGSRKRLMNPNKREEQMKATVIAILIALLVLACGLIIFLNSSD